MGIGSWLRLKYYQWELSTAAYMLEPWEKLYFNVGILLLLIFWAYYAVSYGPAWFASVVDVLSSPFTPRGLPAASHT